MGDRQTDMQRQEERGGRKRRRKWRLRKSLESERNWRREKARECDFTDRDRDDREINSFYIHLENGLSTRHVFCRIIEHKIQSKLSSLFRIRYLKW